MPCGFSKSHGAPVSFLASVPPLVCSAPFPFVRPSLLAKIEIGDYYLRQERGLFPLKTANAVFFRHRHQQRVLATMSCTNRSPMPVRSTRAATLPHVANLLTGEGLLALVKQVCRAAFQDRTARQLHFLPPFPP